MLILAKMGLRNLVVSIVLLIQPIVMSSPDIRIVFSDLDGTLIHYNDKRDESNTEEDLSPPTDVVSLPASSTGMVGTISRETFVFCREIRSRGCQLIFVSGMRFSTLLSRLPYLPRADIYACDSGGRIFRATKDGDSIAKRIVPKDALDEPFYLQEDMAWRRRMESIVGKDGYFELNESDPPLPISARSGVLWKYAAKLQQNGIVIDAKSYSTCFRINRKHNDDAVFDTLLANGLEGLDKSLTTSVNLGCIDVVPKNSGKKNWYVCRRSRCVGSSNAFLGFYTRVVANTWQSA